MFEGTRKHLKALRPLCSLRTVDEPLGRREEMNSLPARNMRVEKELARFSLFTFENIQSGRDQ